LYTDGVLEARMATRHAAEAVWEPEQFDMERLCVSAARHFGHHPKELVEAVNEEVRVFCEPSLPHDDCTMIALRYL
jgi:serine phosphatase RsbU (regulator of sigma subunit)